QTKVIIWAALSSQFIIERIFNVHGISFFILESFTPMTIAASLILVFTPFFFIFQLTDLWLDKTQEYGLQTDLKVQRFYSPKVFLKKCGFRLWKLEWNYLFHWKMMV